MIDEILNKSKENFEKTIEFLRDELGALRTGRASASLVENISVEYYGSKSPLKQIASITVPEPRSIVITPWSKDSLVDVEKAIRDSELNLNPLNDGNLIRVNIPELNEERRREIVKILNQKVENAKIAIRKVREESLDEIQKLEKDGSIGEDDKFASKDKLQKIVDEYNQKIEEMREKKEKEIMQV